MGETNIHSLKTSFNGSVHIEARGDKVTSNAGALAIREVMELTGITEFVTGRINDPRKASRIVYPIEDRDICKSGV